MQSVVLTSTRTSPGQETRECNVRFHLYAGVCREMNFSFNHNKTFTFKVCFISCCKRNVFKSFMSKIHTKKVHVLNGVSRYIGIAKPFYSKDILILFSCNVRPRSLCNGIFLDKFSIIFQWLDNSIEYNDSRFQNSP